jgi:hypothetical protein
VLIDWTDSRVPYIAVSPQVKVFKSAAERWAFRPFQDVSVPLPVIRSCRPEESSIRPLSVAFQGTVWNASLLGVPPFDVRRALEIGAQRQVWASDFVVRTDSRDSASFLELMRRARTCLVPRGAGLHSYRIAEASSCGCVPVVLADEWVMPFEDVCTDPRKEGLWAYEGEPWAYELIVGVGRWPRPRVVMVNASLDPRLRQIHTEASWKLLPPPVLGCEEGCPVPVTVGPYYIRLREAHWWALPSVIDAFTRDGTIDQLSRRVPLAWGTLFSEPVHAALRVLSKRESATSHS